jgi:transposase
MVCGVDISKKSFNYCIVDKNMKKIKEGKFNLVKDDLIKFVEVISKFKNIVVVVESTGIYHINFVSFLLDKGINVKIINPKTIKRFIDYYFSNNPSKTDKKDAFAISIFGIKNPEIINNAKASIPNTIKTIAREIEFLSHQKASIKTKIKAHLSILFPELENNVDIFRKSILNILIKFPSAKKISYASFSEIKSIIDNANHTGKKVKFNATDIINLAKNSIGISNKGIEIALIGYINQLLSIQNSISLLEKELIKEANNFFKDDINIITSIKGISKQIASKIIAEIENINKLENFKKLVKFAGTDPVVKQSGNFKLKKSISKQGNPHLRNFLYQAAIGVITHNPVFKNYYLKKKSQLNSFKKAVIATLNKLIRVIFGLLKSKTKFNIKFHKNNLSLNLT